MSARLGGRSHQSQSIGRGQPDIDLRHLAIAQGAERGAGGALEPVAGFEYARHPGAFRVDPRRECWPIAPEPGR